MQDHSKPLIKALRIAEDSILDGGGPFGSVLVTPGGVEYLGTNRVTATNDPTAHAEVVAIRAACEGEDSFDLSGSILYASCQPCPMCLSAALWARVGKIVFAATAAQAAAAGFDDARFYEQLAGGVATVTDAEVHHLDLSEANGPFEAWRLFEQKIPY